MQNIPGSIIDMSMGVGKLPNLNLKRTVNLSQPDDL